MSDLIMTKYPLIKQFGWGSGSDRSGPKSRDARQPQLHDPGAEAQLLPVPQQKAAAGGAGSTPVHK